ncbi:hypothetical protein NMY22_g8251 [Coprinellus aureogranulatus]|nr:hypothetical protein NMY22_g8251 [Coprinellus aureogranulatus]
MPVPGPEPAITRIDKLSAGSQRVLNLGFANSDTKTRRTVIDGRVLEVERDIASLKSYLNSLTPTCRLPREILAHIFLVLSSLVLEDDKPAITQLSWARLAWVCRYWRAVALDSRELWSTITFQKHNFTDLCLARSREFPMTVVIRELPSEDYKDRGKWGEKLKKVLSQTDRLFCLDVKGKASGSWYSDSSATDLKTLFSYFVGVPKKLQYLVLDCSNNTRNNALPEDFLDRGAPALTYMSLTKTAFKWKIPKLHALTRLHIEETQPHWYGSADSRPSVDAFCTAVSQMPRLETLHLVNAFSERKKQDSSIPTPVALPMTLRNVKLVALTKVAKQFFEAILIPRAAWIDVKFGDATTFDVAQFNECLGALSMSWKDKADDAPRRDIDSLAIVDIHSSSRCPRFECVFLPPPIHLPGALRPFSFGSKLRMEFTVNKLPVHDIFKLINNYLDLATVRFFTVDNTWSIHSSVYAQMLHTMPALLVINLRMTWMKYLLDAMSSDPAMHHSQDTSASRQKPRPYCPALEVLHFHLTDFNEHDDEEPQALKQTLRLFEVRAEEYGLRNLFITEAKNFDHPDARAVTECFQRIGLPGMQFFWDGSVNIRKPVKPPVIEVSDGETGEDESEEDEEDEGEDDELEEEDEEDEEEYECTASDLEIDDEFY